MDKHLEYGNDHIKERIHSGSQDDIACTLKETREEKEIREKKEKVKKDIEVFQKLVQHYYDIDSVDEEKGKDKIYTMVKYQGKEMLIPIGAGEYHSEMFTHKDDSNHVGFLYGPLTLFVVKANHHDDVNVNPRTFLNEHVSFYSPIGGQVQIHGKGMPIEYGKHNKIMSYEEAMNVVQNASIRKVFYNRTSQRNNLDNKFIKKMKVLRDKTLEEIRIRYTVKIKFDWSDEEYMKLRTCLSDLSNGNVETMYSLIQNFNRHKGVFTQPDII